MSGHSKWNNIKNKKAAVDAKKGKTFSQLSKLIRIAVKEGASGDPASNPTLRTLLEKARAANMPKVKIQKSIDVALGKGGNKVAEVAYEGFGPGGVGMIIVTLSDNLNRTTSEMKTIMSRAGGSIGSPGSVKYMFTRGDDGGYISTMPMEITDSSTISQLESLIEQLETHDDVEGVYCVGEWEGKE